MAEIEIDRDERVMSADGTDVGHVKHVIVDRGSRRVTDVVVAHHDGEYLLPISAIERGTGGELMLRGTPDEMRSAQFMREEYHAVDEDAIADVPSGRTGSAGTIENVSHDKVMVDDTRGAAGTAADTRRTGTGRDETISVPVVEEQLKAGVRETEAGRFRLVKDVHQEQQTIDVPVQREEVYVTERAVNRPATEAELRMRDRDIEIPLREQEVVARKQAVVMGEVNVRKETVTDTERVSDTVRREEVHVEGGNSDRVHTEGNLSGRGTTGGAGKTVTDRRQYDAQGNLVAENETVDEGPRGTR